MLTKITADGTELEYQLRGTGAGEPVVLIHWGVAATWAEPLLGQPALTSRYPGLAGNLVDEQGGLHKFVNVYLNDEDIRYLDGIDTKVGDGDVLSILPAVAGG